ncbi:MAG: hypothetical protein A2020_08435 [Lentisphaerae bacterium GWF2_45_14]|nr:MAG: hypothetical protein A2020_08435 [Lentisphaerae bacterium GWF2_45_14]
MGNKITDIAKAAGVSIATVSRVYGKHPYVKENLRTRVFKAAQDLNYAPKFNIAKNTFAILTGSPNGIHLGNFESALIRAISIELFKVDYNVQIITEKFLPFLHSKTFSGVIDIRYSSEKNIPDSAPPFLTVNHPRKGVHSVATDHAQGLELAVDYLAKKGHKKISFISGNSENWGNRERFNGYKRGLEKNGIEFDKLLFGVTSNDGLTETVLSIMKKKPTAIIVSGEGCAHRLNYSLYLLDEKIPEDVSVITFEDVDVSQFLTPPHTTISQNMPKLAEAIAQTALEISKTDTGNKSIKDVILENELIERESVKDLT